MVPWSPAVVIGLPVGIWTLVVLLRPEVKQAFARKAVHDRLGLAPPPLPGVPRPPARRAGFVRRAVRSVVGGVFSLVVGSRVGAEEHSAVGTVPPPEQNRPWGTPVGASANVAGVAGAAYPAHGWPADAHAGSPPLHTRRSLWPWVAGACLIGLLLVCLVSIPLTYVASDRRDVGPSSLKAPSPPPSQLNLSKDLLEWQYPGSRQFAQGWNVNSRHLRLGTPDDLEKVSKWYEQKSGARLRAPTLGAHGAGTIGDVSYDYQDDSTETPDGEGKKVSRPVAVRLLVLHNRRIDLIAVVSRAQGEQETHVVLTRIERP
jgi:hypothetical protein